MAMESGHYEGSLEEEERFYKALAEIDDRLGPLVWDPYTKAFVPLGPLPRADETRRETNSDR
jgi:hypothetical protein